MPVKKKREKVIKYKTSTKVLDNSNLQAICSCGWKSMEIRQVTGEGVKITNQAILAAVAEIESHTTHLEKK